MDYLWTPWRYQYVTTTGGSGDCVFCAAAKSSDDEAALVVHRGEHNFVILNRYPYSSGHVMVIPYAHVATLENLDDATLGELIVLARRGEKNIREVYRPDGLNIGLNIGRAAGAGLAEHLHMHILPRWFSDTNFMTTVGETRVMPEDLRITWEKLRGAFQRG